MDRVLINTIKKCLKNERKAQFDLYHECFDHLMRICRRYKHNRDDAVALLNEAFLKILLNLDSYDFDRNFQSWISTIMVRTAIDHYRRNNTYVKETDFAESDEDLERSAFSNEHIKKFEQLTEKEIREIIFQLPEHERVVFNLYEVEGYKHREISEKLGVTQRTTKRRLKAAKEKLKSVLENRVENMKKVI